jgi:integrase
VAVVAGAGVTEGRQQRHPTRGPNPAVPTHNLRQIYQSAVAAASEDLADLDLHGPHDLRHTFATWLEDAGIPARVIDELMGHEATGRSGQQRGSAMGAHYRHTTPEMAARIVEAIQQRLTIVLHVADESLENNPNRLAPGVF